MRKDELVDIFIYLEQDLEPCTSCSAAQGRRHHTLLNSPQHGADQDQQIPF